MKVKTCSSLAIVITIVIMVASCDTPTKKKIELLTKENEALRREARIKDSTLNEFFAFLSDIEYNLNLIKQKEQSISQNAIIGGELKPDVRHQIDEDIQTINLLMDENRRKAALLRKKLSDANFKVAELERMIASISKRLIEKEEEIDELKAKLLELNFTVEQLNARIDSIVLQNLLLDKEIKNKTEKINSAWYAVGSRKELVQNNIIDKSGGFLGLGRTTKMKAEFNQDYFVRIDITETHSIPILAKRVKLVTTHPTNSYSLVRNNENLVVELNIKDPEKFWSVSKYLVVEVN